MRNNSKKQKAICNHALKSQSKPRLLAMEDLAKHIVPITPDELDVSPLLINCLNGTIDLKKRKLLPHNPAHLITKICNAKFDSKAKCPIWLKFLDQIMNGDHELIQFLQRVTGYALTGSTEEQCLFILHGRGRNGKTTFLETLSALFGGYAKKAEMRSFMSKKGEGVNNDIATLCGARLVSAVEAGRGKALDEPLVKELSGGDQITARFLYREFFTFVPKFKIFLAVNTLPKIQGSDEGIWRRLRLIPFNVTIPEEDVDKKLAGKLRKELSGIFTWAINGAVSWRKRELLPPKPVISATQCYREEEDLLANFIDEKCFVVEQMGENSPERVTDGKVIFVSVGDIYQNFIWWLGNNHTERISKKLFGQMMSERGFQSVQKKVNGVNTKIYKGIGLKGHDDFDDDFDFD